MVATTEFTLSPTSLNLLRDCPRCFWLDSKGIHRPEGAWSTVPRKLDQLISREWDDYRFQGQYPPLLAGRLEGVAVDPRVNGWYFAEVGLWLRGRLDACIRVGDAYAPVDHKSRGYPAAETHPAYQLQLDSYSLLLQESGRQATNYAYLLYWIPEGAGELTVGLPVRVDVVKVETNHERVRAWMRQARTVLNLASPPAASPGCSYCDFVESVTAS